MAYNAGTNHHLHHCMLGKKFYLQGFGKKILTETKVTFLLTNLNPDFAIQNLIFRFIKD